MRLKTAKFGEVEVDESLIFNFVEPILGYEELNKFALIDHQSDSPFKWLQSVENPAVALPITVPSYFGIDYQYIIPEEDAKKLEVTSAENILTVNVVNIPQGRPQDTTVNLLGPIVINVENKKASQLILNNTKFSVRQRLFDVKPETKNTVDSK